MPMDPWSPSSWRAKPIEQVPVYAGLAALAEVERQIAGFPPLVFAGEARKLKRMLGKVAARRSFSFAGRRLRREFCRTRRRKYPRFFSRVPANGGGDDLCRRPAVPPERTQSRLIATAKNLVQRIGDHSRSTMLGDLVDISLRKRASWGSPFETLSNPLMLTKSRQLGILPCR